MKNKELVWTAVAVIWGFAAYSWYKEKRKNTKSGQVFSTLQKFNKKMVASSSEMYRNAAGTEINASVEKGIKWPCWNSATKQWCWCTSGSMHCKARGVKIRD